jgi:predicted nucleic acid-binding protein
VRVLDASITLAWLFKRADPVEAALAVRALNQLPDTETLVPPVWFAEVANSVLRGERAGVVSSAQAAFFLERLSAFRIQVDSSSPWPAQARAIGLARQHALTAYDACYLELAQRSQTELATFDRRLAAAARQAGVRVFGDPT